MAVDTPAINEDKLNAFMGQIVGELGATVNAGLIVVGDRLGLYRAMAGAGPISAGQLAKRTKTAERYVREWLNAQAAGGFVEYDPATDLYLLPAEQAMALADEGSPAFVGGAFQLALATLRSAERIESAFKSGGGVGWHEHDEGCPSAASASSGPDTVPIWSAPGCRRSKASRANSGSAPPSPMSAMGSEPPLS